MRRPFKITVCGIEELPGCSAIGVSHVLSILDPGWPVPEAFGSFGEHERLELRFHDVIEEAPGMLPPLPEHIEQLLAFGRTLRPDAPTESHLLVHCHAGVSRSSAAMGLLLAQAMPECPGMDIFAEIMRVRPGIWPNLRVLEIGDGMLGRSGELIAAARGVYRVQIGRKPETLDQMRAANRTREIDLAVGGEGSAG